MKKYLLFLFVIFIFMGCSDSNNQLLDKLQTAVTAEKTGKAEYNVVKLDELTDFEWDTVYFFAGQVNPKEIADEIGIKWDGKATPGGHDRLLFVHNNKVVSYIDYKLEELPLRVYGCNQDRWVYPRSRSTFATFKYCQDDKEVYAFIPEPCFGNIRELKGNKCPEKTAKK
jgi:hypothetical protein